MLVRTRNFLLFLVEKNNNSIDFYHLLFCQKLNCSTVKAIVWVSVMILYITLCKISSYIFQIGCEPRVFWPGEELSLESLERLFVNWSEVPGTCSSTRERIASVRAQVRTGTTWGFLFQSRIVFNLITNCVRQISMHMQKVSKSKFQCK